MNKIYELKAERKKVRVMLKESNGLYQINVNSVPVVEALSKKGFHELLSNLSVVIEDAGKNFK